MWVRLLFVCPMRELHAMCANNIRSVEQGKETVVHQEDVYSTLYQQQETGQFYFRFFGEISTAKLEVHLESTTKIIIGISDTSATADWRGTGASYSTLATRVFVGRPPLRQLGVYHGGMTAENGIVRPFHPPGRRAVGTHQEHGLGRTGKSNVQLRNDGSGITPQN